MSPSSFSDSLVPMFLGKKILPSLENFRWKRNTYLHCILLSGSHHSSPVLPAMRRKDKASSYGARTASSRQVVMATNHLYEQMSSHVCHGSSPCRKSSLLCQVQSTLDARQRNARHKCKCEWDCCEWECSHQTQATSKELSAICVRVQCGLGLKGSAITQGRLFSSVFPVPYQNMSRRNHDAQLVRVEYDTMSE